MSKIVTNDVFEKALTDVVTELSTKMYEPEPFTDEEIAELFDLSEEESTALSKTINDNLVAENKVYSNKFTEQRLTEIQADMSLYVDSQIAESGNLSYKIANDSLEITDPKVMYLIQVDMDGDGTGDLFQIWMLIDGQPTVIGNTNIEMSDYVLMTDLLYELQDYAKTNETLSASSVVNNLSSISNDTVLSTQGLSDTLVDYAKSEVLNDYAKTTDLDSYTKTEVLDNYVAKTSISTTLDSSSTDEQVPSAKVVYDELQNINTNHQIKSYTSLSSFNLTDDNFVADDFVTNFTTIINKLPSFGEMSFYIGTTYPNLATSITNKILAETEMDLSPSYLGVYIKKSNSGASPVKIEIYRDSNEGRKYIFTCIIDNLSTTPVAEAFRITYNAKQNTCFTTIADIPSTQLTLDSTKFTQVDATSGVTYSVKNGICYVSVYGVGLVNVQLTTFDELLPKPAIGKIGALLNVSVENDSSSKPVYFRVMTDGSSAINSKESLGAFWGTFSYPVAES